MLFVMEQKAYIAYCKGMQQFHHEQMIQMQQMLQRRQLRASAPEWTPKKLKKTEDIKLVRSDMDMPKSLTDKDLFKIMSLVKNI